MTHKMMIYNKIYTNLLAIIKAGHRNIRLNGKKLLIWAIVIIIGPFSPLIAAGVILDIQESKLRLISIAIITFIALYIAAHYIYSRYKNRRGDGLQP